MATAEPVFEVGGFSKRRPRTLDVQQKRLRWPKREEDIDRTLVLKLVRLFAQYGGFPKMVKEFLPERELKVLLKQARTLLESEANVVSVTQPEEPSYRLTVVGDTHGQFYDLLRIFELHGLPSQKNWYIFNGDYVDRGAWGVEVFVTLCAFKLLYPGSVFLLRGNHETSFCNRTYGFQAEVAHKFSASVYRAFQITFSCLPLAAVVVPTRALSARALRMLHGKKKHASAVPIAWDSKTIEELRAQLRKMGQSSRGSKKELVDRLVTLWETRSDDSCQEYQTFVMRQYQGLSRASARTSERAWRNYLKAVSSTGRQRCSVLILHGGLFRSAPWSEKTFSVGSMRDLIVMQRKVMDPEDSVVEDVLWSDPRDQAGCAANVLRGSGLLFGPDATQEFLKDAHTSLLIRSHEGPDARRKRKGLETGSDMMGGYSFDQLDPEDNLSVLTVFSAPRYPMGTNALQQNRGAVVQLHFSLEGEEDPRAILAEENEPKKPTAPTEEKGTEEEEKAPADGSREGETKEKEDQEENEEAKEEPSALPSVGLAVRQQRCVTDMPPPHPKRKPHNRSQRSRRRRQRRWSESDETDRRSSVPDLGTVSELLNFWKAKPLEKRTTRGLRQRLSSMQNVVWQEADSPFRIHLDICTFNGAKHPHVPLYYELDEEH